MTVTPPTAGEQLLGCQKSRVVLEDVIPRGKKVTLVGVADRAFANQPVKLVFLATGKVVASPLIGADGRFSTVVPLPPKKQQRTQRSRYQAQIGTARSQSLKLFRRIFVDTIDATGGQVSLTGRVIGPLAPKQADRALLLRRYVSCKDLEPVTTVQPSRNGRFSVSAPAPAGLPATVYQLATKVKFNAKSKRLVKAFTLPRAVDFLPMKRILITGLFRPRDRACFRLRGRRDRRLRPLRIRQGIRDRAHQRRDRRDDHAAARREQPRTKSTRRCPPPVASCGSRARNCSRR